MFDNILNRAIKPLIKLVDRSGRLPGEKPSQWEEGTVFPQYPWDLRTIIIVFPSGHPFRYLNLNVLLGITGVPFDQMERWEGSDPMDAFDMQFCLETSDGPVEYKRYHSVNRELDYRTGEVYFKLGEILEFEGRWPKFKVRFNLPDSDFSVSMELDSTPGFHWWAHFPGLYYHYTSFCDCKVQWQLGKKSGTVSTPALHDHGWGKNMLPIRAPLKVFRYEVLRLPGDDHVLSLWSEGPGGVKLKNTGLLWRDKKIIDMDRYDCRVLEWEVFDNYAGVPCRVPRRWEGVLQGENGRFEYETVRTSEPSTVLGEGFLYAFDYSGSLKLNNSEAHKIEGEGYVEQLGRFLRR